MEAVALGGGRRRGGAVVGLTVAWIPYSSTPAQSVPPIHDISTDLENPPAFAAIVPLRGIPEPLSPRQT